MCTLLLPTSAWHSFNLDTDRCINDLFSKYLSENMDWNTCLYSTAWLWDLDWSPFPRRLSYPPHTETEPLSPRCYDSASRCRYEPLPPPDGDEVCKWQSESTKSFLTLIESRFSHVNSLRGREMPYPRWKQPPCIFIFMLWKIYLHLLWTCRQAITHICLCVFNSRFNYLLHSFWSSFFGTE